MHLNLTNSFNGRMLLITIGTVVFVAVFSTVNKEAIPAYEYGLKALALLIGGASTAIGMLANHTEKRLENVLPTLFGIAICVALAVLIK